jgi:glycosyltransferase involved in cell wall biosynthesis
LFGGAWQEALMKAGIDASNLRAGGGVTHLVELLGVVRLKEHGFEKVTVWGSSATLAKIAEKGWLCKIHDKLLDRSLLHRVFWQRFKLKKLAKKESCDVLFVPGGSDASGFKPMVTMSQNMLPFEWREIRRYGWSWITLRLLLLRLTQSRTYRKADGLIFLTKYARDTVLKIVGKYPYKTIIIPHGINPRFFLRPRSQRKSEEFREAHPCRILYVSIIDVYKLQWHVVDAVAQLKKEGLPVQLDLVGPAYLPALKRLNKVLRRFDPQGKFIHYHGPVPYEELFKWYHQADIFIFASSCENMPNILLEAMAAGLPIACSNRGPMPDILGDAGLYFDPENPAEIACAIRSLFDSPDLRTEKGEAAYRSSKAFTWQRCAEQTFQFLAQQAADAPQSKINSSIN